MKEGKIQIRDVNQIVNLSASISLCKDNLGKILTEVDRYISQVSENLSRACQIIQDEATEQENLMSRLRDNGYQPSPQEYEKVNKIHEKASRAHQIVDNFNALVKDFHCAQSNGPYGASIHLQKSIDETFVNAMNKIMKILEFANGYRQWTPTAQSFNNMLPFSTTPIDILKMQGEAVIATEADTDIATKDYQKAEGAVIEKQVKETNTIGVIKSEVMAVCPKCHRPLPICVCKSKIVNTEYPIQ